MSVTFFDLVTWRVDYWFLNGYILIVLNIRNRAVRRPIIYVALIILLVYFRLSSVLAYAKFLNLISTFLAILLISIFLVSHFRIRSCLVSLLCELFRNRVLLWYAKLRVSSVKLNYLFNSLESYSIMYTMNSWASATDEAGLNLFD